MVWASNGDEDPGEMCVGYVGGAGDVRRGKAVVAIA